MMNKKKLISILELLDDQFELLVETEKGKPDYGFIEDIELQENEIFELRFNKLIKESHYYHSNMNSNDGVKIYEITQKGKEYLEKISS